VHELRDRLRELIEGQASGAALTVTLVSFGYKYGLPIDLDLAFDCRFLPNPHFVESLRPRTGTDPAVAEYVLGSEGTEEFVGHVTGLLRFALPRYEREGDVPDRRHGCTVRQRPSCSPRRCARFRTRAIASWSGQRDMAR
jgi:UPF0042 nucleotide-binding protein